MGLAMRYAIDRERNVVVVLRLRRRGAVSMQSGMIASALRMHHSCRTLVDLRRGQLGMYWGVLLPVVGRVGLRCVAPRPFSECCC